MLLGIESNNEGRNVDDLLANPIYNSIIDHVQPGKEDSTPYMTLPDQDTGMMNAFSQAKLVDASLKATFQEIFHFERQDVIKLHARLIKDTNTDKTTDESITLKKAFGILFVEC